MYGLTPLNLALDGTLEQFIELYNFTYEVYLEILKDHPDYRPGISFFRSNWNSYAIPKLLPQFELLAFRRRKLFTNKVQKIHLLPTHFKYFDFFNDDKIREYCWKVDFYRKWTYKSCPLTSKEQMYLNDENGIFEFQESVIELDGFLEALKRVFMRAIMEEIQKSDPSYDIFQSRRDVDGRIEHRMRLRHSECIISNSSTSPPTNSPLFLYTSLNHIGCKLNNHTLVPRKYYAKHTDGKNTVVLPVHYCETCNRYLCGTLSYALFKEHFGNFILQTQNLFSPSSSDWELRGESELHQLGYNVINGYLTAQERQNLLISILESKQLSFFQIVATIEQNIRTFKTNYKMHRAVEKWRSDLEFINTYMLNKKDT